MVEDNKELEMCELTIGDKKGRLPIIFGSAIGSRKTDKQLFNSLGNTASMISCMHQALLIFAFEEA